MSSYITQLEIIRDEDRDRLVTRVAVFSVNKCVKKVDYVIKTVSKGNRVDTMVKSIAAHEAWIYYTSPTDPIVTINDFTTTSSSITINGSIVSPIYLPIKDIGICYSTTSNPTIQDTVVNLPKVWGNFTTTITGLSDSTLYFRLFLNTCVGLIYSDEITGHFIDVLLDIFGDSILDVYGDTITTL